MNPDHTQVIPTSHHLNFFPHQGTFQSNLQQSGMAVDSSQANNQVDGMIPPMSLQQNLGYFPSSSAGQQYNIQGHQQHVQKQMMSTPHYQGQQGMPNYNNNVGNKGYQQQNKQNKGNNSNNTNNNTGGNSNNNGSNTTTMRAGDWICLICSNLNFSFRNECNRCRMQTKQQNFIQNMMMYSQDKFQMNFSYQIGVPTPQQINYEIPQHQQQQHLHNHQIFQQMQQSQQQQHQQQHMMNNTTGQLHPQQQSFIPLLKQNSLKRGMSDKENKEPPMGVSPTGVQMAGNGGNAMGSQSQGNQYSCKQDFSGFNNIMNNNNSSSNMNQNATSYLNQNLQKECINANTPQFFYPHQTNNNTNFKDLKQSQQQQYLQQQQFPHQQLFNCPQSNKSILPNQNFKQNFQLNQQQFPLSGQHLQQSDLNYSHYFGAPQATPLSLSSQSEQQLQLSNPQAGVHLNQTEFYQQKSNQQTYQHPQSMQIMQSQNGHLVSTMGKITSQPGYAQYSKTLPTELQQQFYHPNQQALPVQYQQQFFLDQSGQRARNTQYGEEDEQSIKQQSGQNGFMRGGQCIQQIHQYPNSNGSNLQQPNNNNVSSNSDSECLFVNQMNLNDIKFENQKIISQLEQQTSYFPHPINFLQNSHQIQHNHHHPHHHHAHPNNNNANQYISQQQLNHQLYHPNSNKLHHQATNSNQSQAPHQIGQSSDGTNITPSSQSTRPPQQINSSSGPFEFFGQGQNRTNESKSNQQDSMNLWSGPQRGFENRLLVTPPKTKQFLSSNQPLSDIENMISQFKLMYSTEKKSYSKSIYSNTNSGKRSMQFNSTQKEIVASVPATHECNSSQSKGEMEQNFICISNQDQIQIQRPQQQSTQGDVSQFESDTKDQSTSITPTSQQQQTQCINQHEDKLQQTQSTTMTFSSKSQHQESAPSSDIKEQKSRKYQEMEQTQLKFESKSATKYSKGIDESTVHDQITENTKFKQQVENLLGNSDAKKCNQEDYQELESKEGRGITEKAVNLSTISTQILSKQGTTDRDDKRVFIDEIFTSPLEEVDNEPNQDVMQTDHFTSNVGNSNEFQKDSKNPLQKESYLEKQVHEHENLNCVSKDTESTVYAGLNEKQLNLIEVKTGLFVNQ